MEIRKTACPLDCPDTCSLDVQVQNERVVSIGGSSLNALTAGFICGKVRNFADRLYGSERLQHPLIRSGVKGSGEFRRASWDEALGRITTELTRVRERSGGEAILPLNYGGSNGYLTDGALDLRLFRRLGASELERTVCAAPTSAASRGLYGKMPGIALADYAHAKLIVIWGMNPSVSSIHLVPFIKRAQENGAKLIVIDPRRIPLAKKADLHLPLRPGTDLPLALALLNWLFANGRADRAFLEQHTLGAQELARRARDWSLERAAKTTGLRVEDIEAFARLYAETRPAALRCGWGLERNRCGGSAVAAVLALPAVAGHFGVRAGGYTMSNAGAFALDAERAAGVPAARTRAINMNQLGRALLEESDPSIDFVFVYNHNPLATLPAQGLVRRGFERDDLFTVVLDSVLTDTARYADVVLPATTFLEHDDLKNSYGAYALQEVRAVVPPIGESRPNAAVFAELSRRLGLEEAGDVVSARELSERMFDSEEGASLRDSLARDGIVQPEFGDQPIQFVDVFPGTSDGKIHLVSPDLDREAPDGLYAYRPDPASTEFPLALISPATSRTISSTFGERHRASVPVEMNPADAAGRGLCDGDEVRMWNAQGEVICELATSTDLPPGTVVLHKGIGSHNTRNGNTSNTLAPDTLTDLGAGACFNDARVEIGSAIASKLE